MSLKSEERKSLGRRKRNRDALERKRTEDAGRRAAQPLKKSEECCRTAVERSNHGCQHQG